MIHHAAAAAAAVTATTSGLIDRWIKTCFNTDSVIIVQHPITGRTVHWCNAPGNLHCCWLPITQLSLSAWGFEKLYLMRLKRHKFLKLTQNQAQKKYFGPFGCFFGFKKIALWHSDHITISIPWCLAYFNHQLTRCDTPTTSKNFLQDRSQLFGLGVLLNL